MEKHKIGVLSDTHGLLRPEIERLLEGCEWILHAGDINRQEILDKLKETAPVYAVKGNNDKEWAEYLPKTQLLHLYGKKIFMVHNKKEIPKDLEGIDIIIYGHSHKYEEKRVGGQLWLNPGSCGPRRFTQPITMAVLEIREDGSVMVRKHDIPHQSTVPEAGTGTAGISRIEGQGHHFEAVSNNLIFGGQQLVCPTGQYFTYLGTFPAKIGSQDKK